jgi:hypothetical protein
MKAREGRSRKGIQMATQDGMRGRGISRRQFLTLAGAGAIVGAFILAATQKKGVQGLLKAASAPRTNQATAGKYITTAATPASPSLLQRLFGGKL